MTTNMTRLSVAQGPCSSVLPTVHGCHYAFQNFPFFCVILYIDINQKQSNTTFFIRLCYLYSTRSNEIVINQ